MKTDHQNVFSACGEHISLGELQKRISSELSSVAELCIDVENALGDFIKAPKENEEKTIVTVQNLDRIRQVLENLSALTAFLSNRSNNTGIKHYISVKDVNELILLRAVSARLTGSGKEAPQANIDSETAGVIWIDPV